MKKTIIVLALLFVLCIGIGINSAATNISISNTYNIEGSGIINRNIAIETCDEYRGQKFMASLYPAEFGAHMQFNMSEDIEVMIGDNITDISIYGTLAGTNARAQQYIRNYNIGSIQGYGFNGATKVDYEYAADNFSSLMVLDGETLNRMQYSIKLKEINSHRTLFAETFRVDGYSKYEIESFIENISYPASGEYDWLGCP